MALKRKVLDTGEDQRARVVVENGGQTRYFDMTAEPYRDENGSIAGVLCVSVEETEHIEREERLRSVLREMSHRSKNTLTILLGIARQTAQRSKNLNEFLASFDARLRALVGSQDLLVEHDWRAIPLAELLRTQIRPYLNSSEMRLQLEGPDVRIRAEPAQNLGLALHELARNAHSFGALSDTHGRLRVNWVLEPADDPNTLKIVWQELDGPVVTPPTSPPGFGRTMMERILARALDGRAIINYRPEGVVCEIDVSMAHVEV
jgi:two-component sensor histidine kinase